VKAAGSSAGTSASAAAPRAARGRAQAAGAPAAGVGGASTPPAAAPASGTALTSNIDIESADGSRAPGYGEDALEAVYRVIHERRDIRNDFLSDELPTEVLTRILEAAHTAPSVGFSQPWDFLVLRDEERRRAVHDLAARQRRAYAASLPKARAKAFAALKIEAILDTPVNIVVTCDPTRGGRHTLGRYTQPMMAPFSTCLAVENLWLAARAEGLGVGWVSFFDERELAETLGLPEHLQIVAYLCIGYVKRFPAEPELAGAGWARRRPLSWAVHEEDYGRRAMPGGAPVSLLDATVDAVRGLDEAAVAAARDRQGRMTKPPGSLGVLEQVAEQLAGLAGECPPPLPEPAALAVFAADHGVHAQGVTPWPQEVTAQMVSNFLAGGAVVNAFAKQVGAEVCVVDVGVNANLGNASGLVPRKVRFGTADMTQGPAMTRDEAMAAIEAGIETARDLVAAGNRCLLTGDMGIANTTASAALIAAFTGASPAQVTGYGTGIDEQTYAHKVEIVRRALELHRPDPQDPIGVLSAFGGLEHAALAGFILGGAALRIPVVLDGVIAGAAALVAQAIAPEVTVACVAGHRSAEPGHALALEALGVNPLIDLELRLGEGSGAVLALPLVAAAVRALREVATFDSAGVADASSAAVPPAERGRPA
jgi:nicotinate-nucleotide--dimethylbenzimidazole phosphoribosyltransferase